MRYKCKGGEMMNCGCVVYSGVDRNFFTKEEKIEMLQQRKKALENEAKGIGERITELEEE